MTAVSVSLSIMVLIITFNLMRHVDGKKKKIQMLILVQKNPQPSSSSIGHKQIIKYNCVAPLVVLFYIYRTVKQENRLLRDRNYNIERAPRRLCVKTGDVSIE